MKSIRLDIATQKKKTTEYDISVKVKFLNYVIYWSQLYIFRAIILLWGPAGRGWNNVCKNLGKNRVVQVYKYTFENMKIDVA